MQFDHEIVKRPPKYKLVSISNSANVKFPALEFPIPNLLFVIFFDKKPILIFLQLFTLFSRFFVLAIYSLYDVANLYPAFPENSISFQFAKFVIVLKFLYHLLY